MVRDIILNLAVSLDGYICDTDGDFAWIGGQGDPRADTAEQFDFDAFLASCDTVVLGRKAYEDCGIDHISGAAGKQFLVATHTPRPPEVRIPESGTASRPPSRPWRRSSGSPEFGPEAPRGPLRGLLEVTRQMHYRSVG